MLDDGADEESGDDDTDVVVVEEEDADTEDDSEVVIVRGNDDDEQQCIGVMLVLSLLLVLLRFLRCWVSKGKALTCFVVNSSRADDTPTTSVSISLRSIFVPTTLVLAAVLLRLPTSTTTEASIMSELFNLLVVKQENNNCVEGWDAL